MLKRRSEEFTVLLIPCPWCGPRNEIEFHYGGQADVSYPEDPEQVSDVDWAHFLFYRDNPKGVFAERWSHQAGCRRWFTLRRNTATNEILPEDGASEARAVTR